MFRLLREENTSAPRPLGITAIGALFAFGVVASSVAAISLLTPGGPLEVLWRINPHGRAGFASLGAFGPALLAIVCVTCAFAAYGFFSRRRWGYWLGTTLITINAIADTINGLSGVEPRALFGIPIVIAILMYLRSTTVRSYFSV